ncbi:hypothetical protein JCM11251_005082 [Rhodosporidiobolus azoricus]
MSFRLALRTAVAPASRRTFTTTPAAYKTVTEQVKETAEKVNHAAGDTLLKGALSAALRFARGIELGEKASEAAKDATKPLADAARNVVSDASKDAQKAGAEVSNKATQASSEIQTRAQKAKLDAEKKL